MTLHTYYCFIQIKNTFIVCTRISEGVYVRISNDVQFMTVVPRSLHIICRGKQSNIITAGRRVGCTVACTTLSAPRFGTHSDGIMTHPTFPENVL